MLLEMVAAALECLCGKQVAVSSLMLQYSLVAGLVCLLACVPCLSVSRSAVRWTVCVCVCVCVSVCACVCVCVR